MKTKNLLRACLIALGAMTLCLGTPISTSAQDNCATTFIKEFSLAVGAQEGFQILALENGDYLLTGTTGESLFLNRYNALDELIWERQLNIANGADQLLATLIDSEGMLVGVGRSDYESNSSVSFVFRYNFVADEVVWLREIPAPDANRFGGLQEAGFGGDFYVSGAFHGIGGGYSAVTMRLDRETGEKIWSTGVKNNLNIQQSSLYYSDHIYGLGMDRFTGSNESIRASIHKMDTLGTVAWSRIYLNPVNDIARTYIAEALIKEDTLVTVGTGNLSAGTYADAGVIVMKLDPENGEILWSYKYDFAGIEVERIPWMKIHKAPKGYLISGNVMSGNKRDIVYFQISDGGQVLWAKKINMPDKQTTSVRSVPLHDHIYLFGFTTDLLGNNKKALLVKTDHEGHIGGLDCPCPAVEDLSLLYAPLDNYSELFSPVVENYEDSYQNVAAAFGSPVGLEETFLCGTENLGDNDLDNDGIADGQDNCIFVSNTDQSNADGDLFGDDCDNCPDTPNDEQLDADNDGVGDLCDNCILIANTDQADLDNDGIGDACDDFINRVNTLNPTNFLSAVPNPTDGLLHIQVASGTATEGHLFLVNTLGQRIWEKQQPMPSGEPAILVLDFEALGVPKGIYWLTMQLEGTTAAVRPIIFR